MTPWGVRFCATTLVTAFLSMMMGYMLSDTYMWILGGLLLFYGIAILIEVISANDALPATGTAVLGEVQHLEQIERNSSARRTRGGDTRPLPAVLDSPRDVGRARARAAAEGRGRTDPR